MSGSSYVDSCPSLLSSLFPIVSSSPVVETRYLIPPVFVSLYDSHLQHSVKEAGIISANSPVQDGRIRITPPLLSLTSFSCIVTMKSQGKEASLSSIDITLFLNNFSS